MQRNAPLPALIGRPLPMGEVGVPAITEKCPSLWPPRHAVCVKNFCWVSQKQKMAILDSAAKIGVKQAAELADVHYTSVYEWRRQLKSLGKQGL